MTTSDRGRVARKATIGPMSRRLLAWGPAIPLMVAGVEAGHWVAYRLAYPYGYLRAQVLAQSGHGYLGAAPEVIGLASAVGACALIARAGRRGGAVSDPPPPLLPFVTTCGTCHMLKAANTMGMLGPNLDKVKLTQAQIVTAIKKGGAAVMTKAQLAKYKGTTMPPYASLGTTTINNIAAFVYKSTH